MNSVAWRTAETSGYFVEESALVTADDQHETSLLHSTSLYLTGGLFYIAFCMTDSRSRRAYKVPLHSGAIPIPNLQIYPIPAGY